MKKYQFIGRHSATHEVGELCEALGVSRSAYYRWHGAEASPRSRQDRQHKEAILEFHRKSGGRYGHRPIYHHLLEAGVKCGRDRVLRLMNELGLDGRRKKRFKPLTRANGGSFCYSLNRLRQRGQPTSCNEVWVATTYLETRDGWMHLATVMDLFSRRIVGWSISWRNDAALVCEALKGAVMTRGRIPPDILHHSDRGSTYASVQYQRLLKSYSMKPSMSGKGNCYDNAAKESFYGRYKSSSVKNHIFANEAELRRNVFDYIEIFYNRFRKHSSLGYKSPDQMEKEYSPSGRAGQDAACQIKNQPITTK